MARRTLKRRDVKLLLRAAEYGIRRLTEDLVSRSLDDEDTTQLERLLDAFEGALERVGAVLEAD